MKNNKKNEEKISQSEQSPKTETFALLPILSPFLYFECVTCKVHGGMGNDLTF